MKMANLQCLRISSDMILLSSEVGLLKRPTYSSDRLGSNNWQPYLCSSLFARDTTWKVVKVKESLKGSISHARLRLTSATYYAN